MDKMDLKYLLALSMLPGVGKSKAKKILAEYHKAQNFFREKEKEIAQLLHRKINSNWSNVQQIFEVTEREIELAEEEGIEIIPYHHHSFPNRLKHCPDGPLILYTKGKMKLDEVKVLSIVGSRNASQRGKQICKRIVRDLREQNVLIVSGLAYGIDICAHKAALEYGLPTVAVLASGLPIVYPYVHQKIVQQMMYNGGIVSDYPPSTQLLPVNFAERNRIVAGLSDATLVVESAEKGGSMITAGLALDYNRDVFAIPGSPGEEMSAGCNFLIKNDQARLVENAEDIIQQLSWEIKPKEKGQKTVQKQLFVDLDSEEIKLLKVLEGSPSIAIDELSLKSGISMSNTSSLLLSLELKGLVCSLPGKIYQLV